MVRADGGKRGGVFHVKHAVLVFGGQGDASLEISAGATSRSAVRGAGYPSCRVAQRNEPCMHDSSPSPETNGTGDKYRAIDRKYCDADSSDVGPCERPPDPGFAQLGDVRQDHSGVAGVRWNRPIGQKNAEMNGPYHSDGLRVKSEPAIIRPIHFSDRFVHSPVRGIHHAFSHRI